jgi:hypothetical protein
VVPSYAKTVKYVSGIKRKLCVGYYKEPHSDVGLFVLLRDIGDATQKIDPFLTIKIEYLQLT